MGLLDEYEAQQGGTSTAQEPQGPGSGLIAQYEASRKQRPSLLEEYQASRPKSLSDQYEQYRRDIAAAPKYAAAAPDAVQQLATPHAETSFVPPERQADFDAWLKRNQVQDLDHPDSHYDYRGAYLAGIEGRSANGHWPDTFKQHGHPTFSNESRYARGDGGHWAGETYVPPAPSAAPKPKPVPADLDATLDRFDRGQQDFAHGLAGEITKTVATGPYQIAHGLVDAVFGEPTEEELRNPLVRASIINRMGRMPDLAPAPKDLPGPAARAANVPVGMVSGAVDAGKALLQSGGTMEERGEHTGDLLMAGELAKAGLHGGRQLVERYRKARSGAAPSPAEDLADAYAEQEAPAPLPTTSLAPRAPVRVDTPDEAQGMLQRAADRAREAEEIAGPSARAREGSLVDEYEATRGKEEPEPKAEPPAPSRIRLETLGGVTGIEQMSLEQLADLQARVEHFGEHAPLLGHTEEAPATEGDLARHRAKMREHAAADGKLLDDLITKRLLEGDDEQPAAARAQPEQPTSRREELEQKYGSDDALGVRYDEQEERSVLPNGEDAVTCTNCARHIVTSEGKGRIVGYGDKTNPTAGATGDFPGSGHDFAIVDDRYIVDPWVKETANTSKRAVFDLTDPKDQPEIARLYGDPKTWSQIHGPESPIPLPLGFRESERVTPAAPEPSGPITVRGVYRGVPAGRTPEAPGIGGGRFFSPDEKVAKSYAGEGGSVAREDLTFQRPLTADNWQVAKEQLGLPRSASMDDLIRAAGEKGHDGIVFRSHNGKPEYVALEKATKAKLPTSVSHAETGKPFQARLLRGQGRTTSPYSERAAGLPIVGEGRYTTPDREYAEHFGPTITEHDVSLESPLVIENDKQWGELTDRAGWEYRNPTGLPPEQVKGMIARLRAIVEGEGHDGIVIKLDPRGDYAKSLRRVFGADQVVEFRPSREAPPEPAGAPQTPAPRTESAEDADARWIRQLEAGSQVGPTDRPIAETYRQVHELARQVEAAREDRAALEQLRVKLGELYDGAGSGDIRGWISGERAAITRHLKKLPKPGAQAQTYVTRAEVRGQFTEEQAHVRQVARDLKEGDPAAIEEAAQEMAARVPRGAAVVPVPGHEAGSTPNLQLAQRIAELVGGKVHDLVQRETTLESARAARKAGKKPPSLMRHRETLSRRPGAIPVGKPVVLIDNLEVTGTTAKATREVLGRKDAELVTYAKGNPNPPRARAPVTGPIGRQTPVLLPNGEKLATRYRVVEAGQLLSSHDPHGFQPSEGYPAGVQGRDYLRNKGAQATTRAQALEFNPDIALNPSTAIGEGQPTILPDGTVLAGNARSMVARLAAELAPERYRAYHRSLVERAGEFGLDPKRVAGMKRPVLVREITDQAVVDAGPKRWAEINRLSDEASTKRKSAVEEGAGRAQALRGAAEALYHFADTITADQTLAEYLGTAPGRRFVQLLVENGVISKEELGRYTNGNGALTVEGRTAIRDMLLSTAVTDPSVLLDAPTAIVGKLEHAVPAIVGIRDTPWDPSTLVTRALELLGEAKAKGLTLSDLEGQGDLLGRAQTSPLVADFARYLQESSKAEVTAGFRRYGVLAREAVDAAGGNDMFGGTGFTPATGFRDAFKLETDGEDLHASQGIPQAAHPDLFGQTARDRFLEGSVVQHQVFHGTRENFRRFTRTTDIGFHFGTAEQASARAVNYGEGRESRPRNRGPNVMPAYISLKNPVRLKSDFGDFSAGNWQFLDGLVRKGVLTEAEADRLFAATFPDRERAPSYRSMATSGPLTYTANRLLRELLESKGYDGLVYPNIHEGPGESYTVFRPEQIKSATGNRGTFNPRSSDIHASEGIPIGPDLFGEERKPAAAPGRQESLFGSEAGTTKSRSTAEHLRALEAERDKLRQLVQAGFRDSPSVNARLAELDRVLNRDRAIGPDELATRARAEEDRDAADPRVRIPGERGQSEIFGGQEMDPALQSELDRAARFYGERIGKERGESLRATQQNIRATIKRFLERGVSPDAERIRYLRKLAGDQVRASEGIPQGKPAGGERITAAAIRDPQTGTVYTGRYHSDIVRGIKDPAVARRLMRVMLGDVRGNEGNVGFATTEREIISRNEAAHVAKAAGQLHDPQDFEGELANSALVSEDVHIPGDEYDNKGRRLSRSVDDEDELGEPPGPEDEEAPAAPEPTTAGPLKDAWLKLFAPGEREGGGKEAAGVIRHRAGELAHEMERARDYLRQFRGKVDRLSPEEAHAFIDDIEAGRKQRDPTLQPVADALRALLDKARADVQALGTGKLSHFYLDYFPHIWADPVKAREVLGRILGRRPIEGPRAFLKKRSIVSVGEGLQHGLELVTDNPLDLVLLKLREMRRYVMGQRVLADFKAEGLAKYVAALNDRAPAGWQRLDDHVAMVFGPPDVTVMESFDPKLKAGLEGVIKALGGKHERATTFPRRPRLGEQQGNRISTRFGTDITVLEHELGHLVDDKLQVWDRLVDPPGQEEHVVTRGKRKGERIKRTAKQEKARVAQRKVINKELRDLADMRFEGHEDQISDSYKDYVREAPEKIANAIHALIYMPERMETVAPTVKARLTEILESDPRTKALLQLQKSLVAGTAEGKVPVGGLVVKGQYWAPEPVAAVLNNYLAPGLRGNPLYDAYMGVGNVLNQAQLGLSAFHLGFTSVDAATSKMALAIEQLASGRPIRAARTALSVPAAPLTTIWRGSQLRKAYLKGALTPEMGAIVESLIQGGGRVRMDQFYSNNAVESFLAAVRERRVGGAVRHVVPAALEALAKPILEVVVPRQKLGVFADLARFELERMPKDATPAEVKRVMARVWDSVDNRMGQLVYDNLFWNRTLKDLAMASTRSVGWNLGTIREIGGGAADLARGRLTHRAAYVIALPLTVGLAGAVMTYLYTGRGPQSLKDYFLPPTGRLNEDGDQERVQLPSYIKDVIAYARHPVTTVEHKLHPLLATLGDMLRNEDYYGNLIRNDDDPLVVKIGQEAEYLAKQFIPFGVRNAAQEQQHDQSLATRVAPFFGVTPAARELVRSPAQQHMAEMLARRGHMALTPEEAEASDRRRNILQGMRTGTIGPRELVDSLKAGVLTNRQAQGMVHRRTEPPVVSRFKQLTWDEAEQVYLEGSERERQLWWPSLWQKRVRAWTELQASGVNDERTRMLHGLLNGRPGAPAPRRPEALR